MNRAFKFRYASEIAGGFVLLALALLVAGILIAGHRQEWFQKRLVLHARFPVGEGTYGLQEGAEVRVLGTLAGRVSEIAASEEGGMEATLVIKRKFRTFIRENSVAKVKKKFEVFGDAYVEVTLGDPKLPKLNSGDYITPVQDVELIQTARKMLDDLRAEAVPMLEEFRGILSHVNAVTRQLEEREGTVGRLISDPAWAQEFESILKDLKTTTAQLPSIAGRLEAAGMEFQQIVGTLDKTAARFPVLAEHAEGILAGVNQVVTNAQVVSGGLTGEVGNVAGVLLQAEATLREIERLVEGLQRHWLVRRYVTPEEAVPLLPALEVRAGEGGRP